LAVRFTLSEAARVTFTLQRRRGHRFVRVLRRTAAFGAGARSATLRLSKGRHLKLGRYRLTLVAYDAMGNRAAPLIRSFRVVPR
jgi:hypothetical protein